MTDTALMKQLRESPEFQAIMKELRTSRPLVPAFAPCKTMDETANLMERMKYESARQTGWDGLFQALTGLKPTEY